MTDQLLSKFHIIPSINEYVQWMSDNNENCPSEPRVASTVRNANILCLLSQWTKSIVFGVPN